jgi:putative oxidoreductase
MVRTAKPLVDRVLAVRDIPALRDVALLFVRIGLAWIFIYHGAGTLFGAFGGPGIHRQTEFFSSVAHLHPGTFFAVVNGIVELFGGIAVGLGVLGRLAALGLVGDMVVAMATVTFRNGIVSNAAGGGYELNLVLIVLALSIVLLGSGRISVDAVAGWLLTRGRHGSDDAGAHRPRHQATEPSLAVADRAVPTMPDH